MKISKFMNRFYILEADEGKVITTVLDPPEGEERIYSKKIYIGKWGKVEDYKELIDYENFKKNILAVNCSIEKINPEKAFNKYFKVELPFELKKEKKNGFPDAFISEYLNDLSKKDNNKIYFIIVIFITNIHLLFYFFNFNFLITIFKI